MPQTKTPLRTPSPKVTPSQSKPASSKPVNSLFMGMAVDMSWRLAMAVLVPIIGGVYLDKLFSTSPLCLIIGFVLAIVATVLTIRRTMRLADNNPAFQNGNKETDV